MTQRRDNLFTHIGISLIGWGVRADVAARAVGAGNQRGAAFQRRGGVCRASLRTSDGENGLSDAEIGRFPPAEREAAS